MVKAIYGGKDGLQINDSKIDAKIDLPNHIRKFYEPLNFRKVNSLTTGWCGSDLHILERIKKGNMKPRTLGHEALVYDSKRGKHALIVVPVGCNREDCKPCIKGVRQYCSIDACAIEFAGLEGVHSIYSFVPERCLQYFDKKLSQEEILRAPFYDTLSDVIAAIDGLEQGFKATYKNILNNPKENLFNSVFIIGAGNIGFLSAAYVRELFSKSKILLTDIKLENSFKAKFVKEINAHYIKTKDGKDSKQRLNFARQTAKEVKDFFDDSPSLVIWAATSYDGYLASEVSGQLTAHSILSVGPEERYESGFNFRRAVSHKNLLFASSGASLKEIKKSFNLVKKWNFLNKAIDVIDMNTFNVGDGKRLEKKINSTEKLKVIFDWRK